MKLYGPIRRWPAKHPNFQRMHDVLLRYAKGVNTTSGISYIEPRPVINR